MVALSLSASLSSPACRTVDAADRTRLVVSADSDAALFSGQATFVLRKPERVVTVRPFGEIHIGVEGDDTRCRFVWSKDGLDALSVLEGEGCPRAEGDRVCFDRTRFASNGRAPSLTVDGCAYENDLKWSKLQGAREASVGPVQWRTRCAELPPRDARCDVSYLALIDIDVHDSDSPREGFSFAYRADTWRACFAERDSGPYRVVLDIEDSCGAHARETLAGDSRDLDD